MPLTLNRRMRNVLRNGLGMVQEHRHAILAKWEEITTYVRKTDEEPARGLETAILFFSRGLFMEEPAEIEDRFDSIHDIWQQQFANQFKPNHLIFIITIMENAVHEVIQSSADDSYRKHQAVQYLFSQISERILTPSDQEQLNLDLFLEQLVTSQQLPIEWVATLEKKEAGYGIQKLFSSTDQNVPLLNEDHPADSLFSLSESLLKEMSPESGHHRKVFPLPYDGKTLLIGARQHESSYILPFVTYALQIFKKGEDALKLSTQEQQWKDAVILFNEWIMRSTTLHEAIENITSGFVNYLPFERCALFAYSDTEQRGVGLFGHHLSNNAILNIQEDIKNLPVIHQSLQKLQPLGENMKNLQPIFISNAAQGFPLQYVQEFQLEAVVVAPIFAPSGGKLLGAAILDQGPASKFKLSRETYTALMKFGQSAGEILAKFGGDHPEQSRDGYTRNLSPREIEVLKLMAEGASTSEAAGRLHLSDYTVRDYVSAILSKMNARNRTEAVVKAIRDGAI